MRDLVGARWPMLGIPRFVATVRPDYVVRQQGPRSRPQQESDRLRGHGLGEEVSLAGLTTESDEADPLAILVDREAYAECLELGR